MTTILNLSQNTSCLITRLDSSSLVNKQVAQNNDNDDNGDDYNHNGDNGNGDDDNGDDDKVDLLHLDSSLELCPELDILGELCALAAGLVRQGVQGGAHLLKHSARHHLHQ